jgi:hypothetical protein
MFWQDLRRPSTYLMLALVVALAIKNYYVWTGLDRDVYAWWFPTRRVVPIYRTWPVPALPRPTPQLRGIPRNPGISCGVVMGLTSCPIDVT